MVVFQGSGRMALGSNFITRGLGRSLLSPLMSAPAFFLDFYTYPVLAALCLAVGIWEVGVARTLILVVAGLASWSLLEYLVHRFALHHLMWFSSLHDAHHADPKAYIGTPTLISVAIFYALGYTPVALIFGRGDAAGWMAGLLTGYLAYVVTHWAVHHVTGGNFWVLRRLKRQHAVHHHFSHDTNFGVTTSFWDRVFGTLGKPPQPRPR